MTHADRRTRLKKIADALAEGMTVNEVARHWTLACQTVRRAAREYGVKKIKRPVRQREEGYISDSTWSVLHALRHTTDSYAGIGRKLGLTRERIRQVAAKVAEMELFERPKE